MKIQTERLTLVPMSERFLDSACAYAMNSENARLMVYLPKTSRGEVAEFIRSAELEWQKPQPDVCEFAVLLGDEHIGGMTMYFEGDYSRGELGWIIRRDCWGHGYAVEAARGMMEAFRKSIKPQSALWKSSVCTTSKPTAADTTALPKENAGNACMK